MTRPRSLPQTASAQTLSLSLFDDPAPPEMPPSAEPVLAAAPTRPSAAPMARQPIDHAGLLAELQNWVEKGWLRRLDVALAAFIAEQVPDAPPAVLLLTGLLAQMEGRGHTCLRLGDLASPQAREVWLVWPDEAQQALVALLQRLDPALVASPAAALSAWAALLAGCPAVDDGAAAARHGSAPLVRDADRFYLRRHWRDEQRVAAQVLRRSAGGVDEVGDVARDAAGPPLDAEPDQVRLWLDRLFGPVDPARPDWQRLACAVALRGRFALITGGPGTGKTYTVARLLVLVQALHQRAGEGARPLRIALAAPTGKAAARLRQAIEQALTQLRLPLHGLLDLDALTRSLGDARTLHSLLGARPDTIRLRHDARRPLDVDLLVVDEASMVHLGMMASLLDALPPQARLVLLGDKDQLASVEAGAVLGDLCREAEAGRYRPDTLAALQQLTGCASRTAIPAALRDPVGPALAQQTVMLRESRRFDGAVGRLAQAVNAGQAAQAWRVLEDAQADPAASGSVVLWPGTEAAAVVTLALHGRTGAAGGFAAYARQLARRPPASSGAEAHADWVREVLRAFESFRLLAALREGDWGVAGLNQRIEQALVAQNLLRRSGEWYEGRPVMVTRNDPAAGVHNGDVGLALSPPQGGALRVWFLDGDQLRSVLASRLAHVETAFAMTVHKSQGSEFEHTVLVLPDQASAVLTRELVYTGITRARRAFTLVAPQPEVFKEAIERRTVRASGLPALIGLTE